MVSFLALGNFAFISSKLDPPAQSLKISSFRLLSDSSSLWGTDVYIAVDKEVSGAKMERISGTFLTKVFEGEYKNMGKWTKEMKGFVEAKGKSMNRIYFFYTTCPACAKYYGKNYTVILAEV